MTRKTAPVLDEMLKAIDGIEAAVASKTFAQFQGDWLLKHGVQRGLEIISEASRRLPSEMKASHAGIRWPAIAGIGNVLRHDYHAISDKVIWDVVKDELRPLRNAVASMIQDLDE
jgi:uncharacterized protein with HEPN domain